MNRLPFVVLLAASLSATALADVPTDPTPYDKYSPLLGEGFSGATFLIRYGEWIVAVSSRHQYEGKVPRQLEDIMTDETIKLDPARVVKQRDVQSVLVKEPTSQMQFLTYDPNFTLNAKDEVIVFGHGVKVRGFLAPKNLIRNTYKSGEGPRELEVKILPPSRMAGASGAPVVLKRTGAVVGVVLTANDPEAAMLVGFETLCLPPLAPKPSSIPATSPTPKEETSANERGYPK